MRKFTPQEDQFILDHYLSLPMKRISKLMDRADSTCGQRLHRLGYRVPKEVAQQFARESRYPSGAVPLNKGKKQSEYMTPEGIRRSKLTTFKKGNKPHNTKFDNAIVIRTDSKTQRPYKWKRISLSKWKMLHVVMWEEVNGSIPEGHIIVFKNRDSMDVRIENLELITFAKNMVRNTIHHYPTELKQTFRLLGKLKRKIKDHGTK